MDVGGVMEKVKEKLAQTKEKMCANRKAVCICCATLLLIGVMVGLAACHSCSADGDVSEEEMATSKSAVSQSGSSANVRQETKNEVEPEGAEGESGGSSGAEEVLEGVSGDASAGVSASSSTTAPSAASSPNSGSTNVAGSSSSSGASSVEEPASSEPERHWVEETKDVWVQDAAAWSEQVPIYATVEVSICNVCGADITGNTAAHAKAHMLAGEGSGHHSETRQTITGYETVEHAATGHWETRVVGGHWE